MAAGAQELAAPFDSSELHSAPNYGADFLSDGEVGELLPKTLKDVAGWMSRQQAWFSEGMKPSGQRDLAALRLARDYEYQAKARVYIDIAWHDQISQGSDATYQQLLGTFHQARLKVRQPKGLLAQDIGMDKFILGDLIIKHKLIKGLSGQGLAIRHSSPTERDSGIDLAIPVSSGNSDIVNITVQPGASAKADLLPVEMSDRGLLIHTPARYGVDFQPLGEKELEDITLALARIGERNALRIAESN